MKTAPGAPKKGKDIIGREMEIAALWRQLDKGSVVFTAERRVGKSCVIQKMMELPPPGRHVIKCDVESCRHPSELVRRLFQDASAHAFLSQKARWLGRFRQAYEKIAETHADGWSLPPVQSAWKSLLDLLIKDVAEHGEKQLVIMLDEFPHTIGNFIGVGIPNLAMELLDTMRELRHRYQASGKFRFLIAGSIGLHLIVDELKMRYGYKGFPTNDMLPATLGSMNANDVMLLCQAYLEQEDIIRQDPKRFDSHMRRVTDGIPLYIEHICDKFQTEGITSVTTADIDRKLRELLDDPAVDWFMDAAQRIQTHYSRLNADRFAREILKLLCASRAWISEADIIIHIRSVLVVEDDEKVLHVLELLRRDHYIDRKLSKGIRSYRFYFEIMRRWWRMNKG